MKIYLVRHGESKANENNLFLGHGDLDLTEKGIRQAKNTAEYLKTLSVDVIYSSDLLRAYNTAVQTANVLNLPIIKDQGLREINCGEWDFTPYQVIKEKYPKSLEVWLTNVAEARCDGGESVEEVMNRMVKTVLKIAEQNLGKNILIFSHATAIRCFAGYCVSKNKHGIQEVGWATNASVTEVEYTDGEFKLIEYGKDDFMGEITTGFSE